MRFVHLTLHSRSRLRSRTHILANVIETNKRSLPNSRLSFFIVLVLSARLAILTEEIMKQDKKLPSPNGLTCHFCKVIVNNSTGFFESYKWAICYIPLTF